MPWEKDEEGAEPDFGMGAGQAAIGYADDFVDAAVAKLDATFGKGYAKANPQALSGYIAACSSNLAAFMTASLGMLGQDLSYFDDADDDLDLDEALDAFLTTKKGQN